MTTKTPTLVELVLWDFLRAELALQLAVAARDLETLAAHLLAD